MTDHLTIEAIDFQARCEDLLDQLDSGRLDRITVTQDGRALAEIRASSGALAPVAGD